MEPTVELYRPKDGRVLRHDDHLGLRKRLEGRPLAQDTVELDLRVIAQERLAQFAEPRRRRR